MVVNIQMVILYFSETPAGDVYFLAQDCQTSKGSALGCIPATREHTWRIYNKYWAISCCGQQILKHSSHQDQLMTGGQQCQQYKKQSVITLWYEPSTSFTTTTTTTANGITSPHQWHFQLGPRLLARKACFQGCTVPPVPGDNNKT